MVLPTHFMRVGWLQRSTIFAYNIRNLRHMTGKNFLEMDGFRSTCADCLVYSPGTRALVGGLPDFRNISDTALGLSESLGYDLT